jgi:tight adherence protein C
VIGGPALLAACAVGVSCAALASVVVRPLPRLAARVRPYTIVTRANLGRSADVLAVASPSSAPGGSVVGRLFGPPLFALVHLVGRRIESRDDDQLRRKLRQGGLDATSPDEFRTGQVTRAALFGGVALAVGLLVATPAIAFVMAIMGLVAGGLRSRSRLDHAVEVRNERIRLELYTVNQLLALHVRTGAGPVQAVQRLVDRGHGAVIEDLGDVLDSIRTGVSEPEAFHHAADVTAEPAAARTYKLFATGAERGVDLAGALLDLSQDIRDSRRVELRRTATKRRAAMLIPTIAILAPTMLLFIAAPIPSIVFGFH